jgi:membrane protein DedA with SNARE-associated domain
MIVLFVARFLPGLRTPIFLTAGVTRFVGMVRFMIIDGLAALISVPIWLYLGYYSASNREVLIRWVRDAKTTVFLILLVLVILYVIVKIVKKRIIRAKLINPDIE